MKVYTKTSRAFDNLLHLETPPTIYLGFMSTATYPTGEKVADVARFNNYGGRVGNFFVPPRPFLTTLPTYKGEDWKELLHELYTDYLPRITSPDTIKLIYTRFAIIILGDLRDAIILWDTPPNSPITIAKKGSDNPLIDTKHMVNNATYRIE